MVIRIFFVQDMLTFILFEKEIKILYKTSFSSIHDTAHLEKSRPGPNDLMGELLIFIIFVLSKIIALNSQL